MSVGFYCTCGLDSFKAPEQHRFDCPEHTSQRRMRDVSPPQVDTEQLKAWQEAGLVPPEFVPLLDSCLKDSGKREEFATGSRRDSREGKGRYDLLLMGMPEALRRMAVLLERGAAKYGERNWEKGQPISRYIDSAARHLARAAQGMTDEDHLVQAAWNCLAAVETLDRITQLGLPDELNDVYESPDVEPK